ncbi:MAG: heavy-metal-associated domain-containing protein [Lachnospiraceae bacterium]|nr:heavy-metal-associated domain-containing protein [Lachnospiraceae bacterium]
MYKVTIKIDGMACNMCEAHIADTIRKACSEAKDIKASYAKKEASFIIDKEMDLTKIKEAIDKTGYRYVNGRIEPYEKKKLFGLF